MENTIRNGLEHGAVEKVAAFCEDITRKRRSLTESLERIVSRIRRFAEELEYHGSIEARFGALCVELGFLEEEKRGLDLVYSDFLQIGVTVADLKMELTKAEGEWRFFMREKPDAAETVRYLQALLQQVEEAERRYLSDCALYGNILRGMLPLFLEDLYRFSDGEHNGRGFRTQSILARCGAFCNDIGNTAQS